MNIKASLVMGGISSDHPMGYTSPISPAAMIGTGHEPLMLPPSPSTSNQEQQSHLEWLQQINTIAKQASNLKVMSAPAPQQAHHGMPALGMHHPPVSMHTLSAGYMPAPMFYTQVALAQLQQQQQQQQQPQETEEKRARRLERNRESARKSRRRKKERLSVLEEKVSGLHAKIETERRKQIKEMNDRLLELQANRSLVLLQTNGDETNEQERLTSVLQGTGLNCPVSRSVIDFQYSTLKQMMLPRYQRFLLWLTLHPEQYFSAAKENHIRREGKQVRSIIDVVYVVYGFVCICIYIYVCMYRSFHWMQLTNWHCFLDHSCFG
jgi:flagellar motility protein MotE (MotC chaperone)